MGNDGAGRRANWWKPVTPTDVPPRSWRWLLRQQAHGGYSLYQISPLRAEKYAQREQVAVVARMHNLPLIADAAAEEDFQQCYCYRVGADPLSIAARKLIEGPTSGLVIGKTQALSG